MVPKLGVNIDHIATLREARKEFDPDPIEAAIICEKVGVDSIVCHLREDRRHIHDNDVKKLRKIIKTRLNLEMALHKDIVDAAVGIKPDQATIVPEKRREITTEGGLDVVKHCKKIKQVANVLSKNEIEVSLFIDPVKEQIQQTADLGIPMIELHTGCYANARTKSLQLKEFKKIKRMTKFACQLGLIVNVGHGLKYDNTKEIASIDGVVELNIGHSIIARAVFVGLEKAVKDMLKLIKK